jgi:hypothetical protein
MESDLTSELASRGVQPTASGLCGIVTSRMLGFDAGTRCKTAARLAEELRRCEREIAAAMNALLTGSVPIVDALLWYTDWCRERELILLALDETQIGRM